MKPKKPAKSARPAKAGPQPHAVSKAKTGNQPDPAAKSEAAGKTPGSHK